MFGLFGLFNYLLAVARAKADLPVRSVSEGGLACRSICEGGFNHLLDETFVKSSLTICFVTAQRSIFIRNERNSKFTCILPSDDTKTLKVIFKKWRA